MTWSITALSNSTVSEGGTISYRLSRNHTGVETIHLNTWQNWNGSGVYNGKDSSNGPVNAAGLDYNPVALVVNFGASHTFFDFTVTTLDNNSVPESSEIFGIVAQTPSNSNANIAAFLTSNSFTILDNDPVNTPPTVTVIAGSSYAAGTVLRGDQLISVSDQQGQSDIKEVLVYDGIDIAGHEWRLNGNLVNPGGASNPLVVPYSQLSQLTYKVATATDSFSFEARDWQNAVSAEKLHTINVTAPTNSPPTVTVIAGSSYAAGTVLRGDQLISVSDQQGQSDIKEVLVYDGIDIAGHEWRLNGNLVNPGGASNPLVVPYSQLSQLTYKVATATDSFSFEARDWQNAVSAEKLHTINVTAPTNSPPTVTVIAGSSYAAGTVLRGDQLISVSDQQGQSDIKEVLVYDGIDIAGHEWRLNGNLVNPGGASNPLVVPYSQLSQLTYKVATATDSFSFEARDWQNAVSAEKLHTINVTPPAAVPDDYADAKDDATAAVGPLSLGSAGAKTGVIGTPDADDTFGDKDFFKIDGLIAGRAYKVAVVGESVNGASALANSFFSIRDSGGIARLAGDSNRQGGTAYDDAFGTNNAAVEFTATVNGTNYIAVGGGGANFATQTGGYRVSIVEVTEPGNSTAASAQIALNGGAVSGYVGYGADTADYYTFTPTQGGKVTVNLTGLGADIDAVIVNSAGQRIDTLVSSSSTTEQRTAFVTAGQAYYVAVMPHTAGAGGEQSPYSVALTFAGDSPPDPGSNLLSYSSLFAAGGGQFATLAQFALAAYPLERDHGPTPYYGEDEVRDARTSLTDRGWQLLSASDLGNLSGFGAGHYSNSNAQALVARSGDAVVIAFRGTDFFTLGLGETIADVRDWSDMQRHYDLLKPLLDKVDAYVATQGIHKVFVTGHSLGAGMVDKYMSLHPNQGGTEYSAATFAHPDFNNSHVVDAGIAATIAAGFAAGASTAAVTAAYSTIIGLLVAPFGVPSLPDSQGRIVAFHEASDIINIVDYNNLNVSTDDNFASSGFDNIAVTAIPLSFAAHDPVNYRNFVRILDQGIFRPYLKADSGQDNFVLDVDTDDGVLSSTYRDEFLIGANIHSTSLADGNDTYRFSSLLPWGQDVILDTGGNRDVIDIGNTNGKVSLHGEGRDLIIKFTPSVLSPGLISGGTIKVLGYFNDGDANKIEILRWNGQDRDLAVDAANGEARFDPANDFVVGAGKAVLNAAQWFGTAIDASLKAGVSKFVDFVTNWTGSQLQTAGGPAEQQASASATGAEDSIIGKTVTLSGIVDIIGTDGNDRLIGDDTANELEGGAGNDRVDGGSGNDVIIGGSGEGDDIYDGGADIDTVIYSSATLRIAIDLAAGQAMGAEIGVDQLFNVENVIGGSGDDQITGNAGANWLDGGGGNDGIAAGAGDDILIGGPGNDILDGGIGVDTADYSSAIQGIAINLSASNQATGAEIGTDQITGIENVIGGSGDDRILGSALANRLDGGGGNDALIGGAGADMLTGGAGNDRIVFGIGYGADVVTDFVAGAATDDKIEIGSFTAIRSFGVLLTFASQNGADTVFNFGNGDTLTLKNVAKASLAPSDFAGLPFLAPRNDLNGDGTTDLLWKNASTGATSEWLMSPNGGIAANPPTYSVAGWDRVASGDFNGDGTTDILWKNAGTGATSEWLMSRNGGIAANPATYSLAGWDFVASGDFNGDGTTDLLWKNAATGATSEWLMSPNGGIAANPSTYSLAGWNFVASGDFNGDGTTDLLWKNASTGATSEWLMSPNGGIAANPATYSLAGWDFMASGDFNRDGTTDLLWKNASTGATSEWLMSPNGGIAANPATYSLAGWDFMASGDFNRDGTTDLLWKNASTGATSEWLMSPNGGIAANPATYSVVGWDRVASGDFNGDGTTDMLWKNAGTGATSEWLMSPNGGIAANPATYSLAGWDFVTSGDFNGDGTTDVLWKNAGTGATSEWLMSPNGGIAANPATLSLPGWDLVI